MRTWNVVYVNGNSWDSINAWQHTWKDADGCLNIEFQTEDSQDKDAKLAGSVQDERGVRLQDRCERTMPKIHAIRIWFENYELLELGLDQFEYFSMENVGTYYSMVNRFDGAVLEEKFQAYRKVCFRLKPEANGQWLFYGSKRELPDGKCTHESIVERIQAWADITILVLCYEDGDEKEIRVPYEFKWSGGEESLLQSSEVDSHGCLNVTIVPKLDENEG